VTRVDGHLHVWRAAEGKTPGVTTLVPPQTDVPIEWAAKTICANGIDRAVLVQPVFRGEDNAYVAQCARNEPDRFAAVCVIDPRTPGAPERLATWVARGCRGLRLRPRIADEAALFGDPATFPLWEAAGRLGVVVSVLCGPEHAAMIGTLAERFPDVPIVIDHLAHPNLAAGVRAASFRNLVDLARCSNVFIKISGYYHFSVEPFPFADCWDAMRAAYDRFGPARLVWGSDFPHVEIKCGYPQSMQLPGLAMGAWPSADCELVMGLNALKLYWPAPK
jgi:predicted TIM-barrel fold metal-dependent hydrolase